jgi:glucan endo-1,3-alpha-glucosidase
MLCCPGITPDIAGFKEEIRMAQAAGIDGFALNAGSWSKEPHYKERATAMYEAAKQLDTGFKLFFSADMCCSLTKPDTTKWPSDQGALDIRDMVETYHDHPNQHKVQGKSFLSTFSGRYTTFSEPSTTYDAAIVADAWQKKVLQPLADAGKPVYFVPAFGPHPGKAHPLETDIRPIYDDFPFVGGLFKWHGFAKGTEGVAPAVATNSAFTKVAKEKGKTYMAPVSPLFAAHHGGLNTIFGDVAGGKGIQQLWNGVIADKPQFVEMVTWNDFNERSYMGPARGWSAAQPQANATGFPHLAYLELSEHYIRWYKTGQEPAISEDKLFYFYRTHSKNAVATDDPLPKPSEWDSVKDEIYVTAMLKEPARVLVTSEGTTKSFDLPAGVSDISMPFQEGAQKVEASRGGEKIMESTGDLPIDNSISTYNFNYYSNFVEAP